jgi:hypothetical protein
MRTVSPLWLALRISDGSGMLPCPPAADLVALEAQSVRFEEVAKFLLGRSEALAALAETVLELSGVRPGLLQLLQLSCNRCG